MVKLLNIFISILTGIILAIILVNIYIRKIPLKHGPNSSIIRNKIYKDNNKCFRLEPRIKVCPIS